MSHLDSTVLNPTPNIDEVWAALSAVLDPELGVSITDLGLVYSIEVDQTTVRIVMTTTTPLCPLGSYLEREVRRHLLRTTNVNHAEVEIVHDPLWCPEMMNDDAREILGGRCATSRPVVPTLTFKHSE